MHAYQLIEDKRLAYTTIGPHMVEEHAAKVPGINVGMLP